jgi:hypothetical protein
VIAKRWQDHRNEIELKTRLAADISECVMKTLVAIMQVEEFYSSYKQEDTLGTRVDVSADQEKVKLLKKLEEARNHAYYEGFKVKSHVIQSEIQAHFIEFSKAWNVLIDLVQFVEKLSEQSEAKKRKEQIIDRHVDPPHDKYLKAYEPYEDEKKDKKEDRKLSLDEPVYKALLVDAGKKYNQSHDKHSSIDDFKKMLAAMDVEAWYEVKHVIVERKNNIITNILDPETESPAFHRRILHI